MAKKRVTKNEKLLRAIQKAGRVGLSHKQIVKFMLRGTGRTYSATTRKLYDSTLYGNNSRTGVLDLCNQNDDGNYTWDSSVSIVGPFTEGRYETFQLVRRNYRF